MSSTKTETGTSVVLENGKYVWRHENGVNLRCDRHGEAWLSNAELIGNNAILALVQEIESLREKLAEVHSWIVCAPIAPAEDMMQNAARIEEITRPWSEEPRGVSTHEAALVKIATSTTLSREQLISVAAQAAGLRVVKPSQFAPSRALPFFGDGE